MTRKIPPPPLYQGIPSLEPIPTALDRRPESTAMRSAPRRGKGWLVVMGMNERPVRTSQHVGAYQGDAISDALEDIGPRSIDVIWIKCWPMSHPDDR